MVQICLDWYMPDRCIECAFYHANRYKEPTCLLLDLSGANDIVDGEWERDEKCPVKEVHE